MKKMTASEVKMNCEEIIIYKNGKPLLRVTPIKRTRAEAVSHLFDWGVKGLSDDDSFVNYPLSSYGSPRPNYIKKYF